MDTFNYELKQLCRHNRDGSYATQADRGHILDLVANQLHEMGVRGLRAQGFKPRHVQLLVARVTVGEAGLAVDLRHEGLGAIAALVAPQRKQVA